MPTVQLSPTELERFSGLMGYDWGMNRHVTVDPAVCSGKPCIRGTRIMVRTILGMLAGGYSIERVLTAYPELEREDVVAALQYASDAAEAAAAPGA